MNLLNCLSLHGPLLMLIEILLKVVRCARSASDQGRRLVLGSSCLNNRQRALKYVLNRFLVEYKLYLLPWSDNRHLLEGVGGRPKLLKSIRTALFPKFRPLSDKYFGNRLSDFGSVNCDGKVFSRA